MTLAYTSFGLPFSVLVNTAFEQAMAGGGGRGTAELDFLKANNKWWNCSEWRVRQLSNSFLQIPFVFLKAFLFCCGHLLWMNCCWMNCFWMNCCWMNCVWMNCPSSPDSDPDPDPDPDPDSEVPYRAVRVLCWDNH